MEEQSSIPVSRQIEALCPPSTFEMPIHHTNTLLKARQRYQLRKNLIDTVANFSPRLTERTAGYTEMKQKYLTAQVKLKLNKNSYFVNKGQSNPRFPGDSQKMCEQWGDQQERTLRRIHARMFTSLNKRGGSPMRTSAVVIGG